MSDNWVVQHLMNTLDTWNEKLAEVWKLLTVSPEAFKGGGIWKIMLTINGSLQAVALALLVLFFLAGVVKTSANLSEIKRPEHALKLFLRFAITKGVVTYGLELMLAIFTIIQGVVSQIMRSSGITRGAKTTLPKEMIQAIEDCGFFESIPLWAVTLIGSLFITVLSFIIIMTVYGRFFNEITNLMLSSDADIIIIDPEREYAPLVRAMGGSVIEISATSPNHINAMDMGRDYGETDPIIEKSQFLQSLCEQIIAGHHFAKGQQSIIDRCTENVYRFYQQGNSKRAAKAVIRSIKRTILVTKTLITALSAAGATAVLIILICVLLCSALFFFGDETSDDYLTATGDVKITQVAAAQIGNHGGRKFWKWYGFSERVDWCAILVSCCADKCGYIESGVIPKFSFVPSGVDWFVERGQFRPNSYIPKPGDIVFIDWGGDGTRDHVGIVEKCDGKTVYTIEGNSGGRV